MNRRGRQKPCVWKWGSVLFSSLQWARVTTTHYGPINYLFHTISTAVTTSIEQDTFLLPKVFQSNHSRTCIPILINNQLITPGQLRTQNLIGGKASDKYQWQRYTWQSLASFSTNLNNYNSRPSPCCNSVSCAPSWNKLFVCDHHASVNAGCIIPWFYIKSRILHQVVSVSKF
jgi:hypothetical protein